MSKWIWSVLFAISATQASALSCGFGNTAAAWEDAERYEQPFVTVRGTFYMRDAWRLFEEEDWELPARFEGQILNPDGTMTPIKTPVRVLGACVNGDCGGIGPSSEMVTFLHSDPDGIIAYSMPCSGFPMGGDPDTIAELMACMTGGPCEAEYFN